mmetsp:Transcript_1767/g.2748  ORF Transcript_1767/g.2748 Transcript_1767/m.2748 type:complete len:80 (+) Transcript_1767:157-396(+)
MLLKRKGSGRVICPKSAEKKCTLQKNRFQLEYHISADGEASSRSRARPRTVKGNLGDSDGDAEEEESAWSVLVHCIVAL